MAVIVHYIHMYVMSSPRSYIGTEPSSVKIDNRDRERLEIR